MLKSVYTVEDAVAALSSYKGHRIEVSIARGEDDNDPERQFLARTTGIVDRVSHWPGENEHWTVSFAREQDGPIEGSVTLWREGYEGTDRDGEPERLVIRQSGLLIDVDALI